MSTVYCIYSIYVYNYGLKFMFVLGMYLNIHLCLSKYSLLIVPYAIGCNNIYICYSKHWENGKRTFFF